MANKRYFVKNKHLLKEDVEGVGLILFDETTKETHLLNQPAAYIWELIDGKTDFLDAYDIYARSINFDEVSEIEVKEDFYQTIDLLQEKNIIREIEE